MVTTSNDRNKIHRREANKKITITIMKRFVKMSVPLLDISVNYGYVITQKIKTWWILMKSKI
jgi:hypothetical protein